MTGRSAWPAPLPWLPALPTVADPTWDEYLASRFAQVLERADAVTGTLPDTWWAAALREKDPTLARQVSVWRAAHDVDPSDFRTCGPPEPDDLADQHRLSALVKAAVGGAGFDVETRLPELIAERPLPQAHAARSLDYRLIDVCPEASKLDRRPHREPPTRSLAPPPLPDHGGAEPEAGQPGRATQMTW